MIQITTNDQGLVFTKGSWEKRVIATGFIFLGYEHKKTVQILLPIGDDDYDDNSEDILLQEINISEVELNGTIFTDVASFEAEIKKSGGFSARSLELMIGEGLNYPYVSKGWGEYIKQNTIALNSKILVGSGVSASRSVRKVVVNGATEYWVCGMYMSIIRVNAELVIVGTIPLYGNMRNSNNLIQYAYDLFIDEVEDKVYIAGTNRHVVRVYSLSVLASGGFVSGNAGTGGHLYDIGVVQGIYWSSTTQSNNSSTSRLYNPRGMTKNPINDHILIANYRGYANSQTSNQGFIAEYNKDTGVWIRDIIQYNGTGIIVDIRNKNFTALEVVGNLLYYSESYSMMRCDLSDLAAGSIYQGIRPSNYDTNNFRFKPAAIVKEGQDILVANTLYSSSYDKVGIIKLDSNFVPKGQVGTTNVLDADVYGLYNAYGVINVGDRGLGVGDWYIVANNNRLSLVLLGKVSDGSNGLATYRTYFDVPATLIPPLPLDWSILSTVSSEAVYSDPNLMVPTEEIMRTNNVKVLTQKL